MIFINDEWDTSQVKCIEWHVVKEHIESWFSGITVTDQTLTPAWETFQ